MKKPKLAQLVARFKKISIAVTPMLKKDQVDHLTKIGQDFSQIMAVPRYEQRYREQGYAEIIAHDAEHHDCSLSINLIKTIRVSLDTLRDQIREEVRVTLLEYGALFSRDEQDIGRTSTVEHHIHLVGDMPVARSPYRPPASVKDELPKSDDGYIAILACTNNLPKYAITKPPKNELAETIVHAFPNHVVAEHERLKVVIHVYDRGADKSGKSSRDFFRPFAIKRQLTSAYHPHSSRKTERFNRTLKTSLTMYVNDNQKDWPYLLQALKFACNITLNSVTNVTPFDVVFGRLPCIPLDNIIENEFIDPTRPSTGTLSTEDVLKMKELVRANHEKNKRRMNANLARPTHVRGRSTKLSYTYLGLYNIAKMRKFVARNGDVASDEFDLTFIPR